MKPSLRSIEKFLLSPFGLVMTFLAIFFAITFLVYYFYSPGPQEREQTAEQGQMQNDAEANAQTDDTVPGTADNLAASSTTENTTVKNTTTASQPDLSPPNPYSILGMTQAPVKSTGPIQPRTIRKH